MAFGLGQGYKLYFGLQATAPTTPADETRPLYNAIGEIPDDISVDRSRDMVERRTRDDPNARFVHPGDRTERITFTMNFDRTGNVGYDDLLTCYQSDADGVGGTGSLGYFNITNAVAGDHQIFGECGVGNLSHAITRAGGIQSVNVTLEVNGDSTDAAHA